MVGAIFKRNMLPSFIRRSLVLAAVAALAPISVPAVAGPAKLAQETNRDQGNVKVSIKEAVQFNWGFQGQTQAAGTPNEIGIGGFLPLSIGTNSVLFFDALANVNLADIGKSSSIINTEVAGTTISTSSRLGYRWLNGERSWMFGFNAGYDSRPMGTGQADTSVAVKDSQTVFFQQVAAGLEAVSNSWNFNAYALVPIGETEQRLNSAYKGGALDTFGLDAGYSITPDLTASVGYYYQNGDLDTADGSGVRGRLAYTISNGLTLGANLSYDQAFDTRFSADLKYRFGSNGFGSPKKQRAIATLVMQALSATPDNRNVRVHDTANAPAIIIQSAGGDCVATVDPQKCEEYF